MCAEYVERNNISVDKYTIYYYYNIIMLYPYVYAVFVEGRSCNARDCDAIGLSRISSARIWDEGRKGHRVPQKKFQKVLA